MVAICQKNKLFFEGTMEDVNPILVESRESEGRIKMKEVAKHVESERGHKIA